MRYTLIELRCDIEYNVGLAIFKMFLAIAQCAFSCAKHGTSLVRVANRRRADLIDMLMQDTH